MQICFKAEPEPDSLLLVWVTRIFLHKQCCRAKHSKEAAEGRRAAVLPSGPVSGVSSSLGFGLSQGARCCSAGSGGFAGPVLGADRGACRCSGVSLKCLAELQQNAASVLFSGVTSRLRNRFW